MFAYFKDKHTVSIDPISILYILVMLFSFYLLYLVRNVLVLIMLAFIITVAMNPLVLIIKRRLRVPKPMAIALSYVCLFLMVAAFVGIIIPPLAVQFIGFINQLDLPGLGGLASQINFSLQEASELIQQMSQSASVAFNIVGSAFNGIFTLTTLMVLSFYLMIERGELHKKAHWFTNNEAVVKKVEVFINSAEEQLGGWVRGQLLLMLVVGVVTYIGLLILGVPYALPLALLAGLLEIIPNIGPTVAAVPAVFLAYATFGPVSGLLTLLLYIIIQQLENNILVPRIMAVNAHVNPLVAIVVILVGLELGGVSGALLAIPVYIVLRLIYGTTLKFKL